GQTQEGLEMALNKTAEHGYLTIEFAYLRPEKFNPDLLDLRHIGETALRPVLDARCHSPELILEELPGRADQSDIARIHAQL
ncbi:hypothetical protein ACC739_37615, partial [Rhizobium ruizarguesonis]